METDRIPSEEITTTTDHETIRTWVEQRGSMPARVNELAGDDPGSLAIMPKGKEDDSLDPIPWDEFFETFEDEGLAFVYRTETMGPEKQLYYEFVPRDDVEGATDGTSTTEATGLDTLAKLEGRTTGAESPTGEEPLDAGEVDEDEIVAGETTNRRDTQDDTPDEDVPEPEPSDEESGDGNDESTTEEPDRDEAAGSEGDDADPSGDEPTEQQEGDESDR